MSQADGKREPEPTSGEATKPKRRSLADGPAFRQAMAELENAPRAAPRPEAKAPQAPLPTAAPRRPQRTDPGVAPPPPPSSPTFAPPQRSVAMDEAATPLVAPVVVASEPTPVGVPEPAPVVAPEPAPVVAPEPAPVVAPEPPVAAAEPVHPVVPAPVIAPSPSAVLPPTTELPTKPSERPRRGKWLAALAIGCVASGLAVAFVALRPGSTQPAAAAPVTQPTVGEAKAAAPPQAAAPALAPTGTPSIEAPSAPPTTAAAEGAAPWQDLPQVDAASCKELASGAPKSLSIETAIKDALRFMMQGDAKGAHGAFCIATERGAQTQTVLMGHAQVLLMQMDYRGALQVIDRELELRPSWAAQDLRGDALIRLGQVEEAKQAWFAGAGATQGTDLLLKNLLRANKIATQASLRAGDLRRAERTLRRALALAPRDAEPCRQLADVLDKLGQAPAAARWRAYAATL